MAQNRFVKSQSDNTNKMVVAVSRKRNRNERPQYGELHSSDVSDYDEVEESDYESEDDQPRKKHTKSTVQRPQQVLESEENSLFKALSSPVVAVSELALEWVESYMAEEDTEGVNSFMNMFNLLLKAVGCNVPVQAHDIISPDSAVATVNELSIHFEKQKYHENPFASNNKDVKHFQKNVLEFFSEVIFYAHEKGCLYQELIDEGQTVLSSDFMTSLILWFSALSASNLRPFRHVATVVTLNIVTQLCHQAASLEVSLERQERQLNNAKNSSNKSKLKRLKIEVIQNNIDRTNIKIGTINEYLDEVTRSVFVHRYRDLDSTIRVECLHALGDWMVSNPAYFLLSAYLRYFGWLLSDPTDAVRDEVVRSLHRLYKFLKGSIENMAFSFRKFTKRFQQQLINMIWKENLASIKINLFAIYSELLKIGFLLDSDKSRICSYVFYLAESELHHKQVGTKLKAECSRFITIACIQATESTVDKHSKYFQKSSGPINTNNIAGVYKLKYLAAFFQESIDEYSTKRPHLFIDEPSVSSWKMLKGVFTDLQIMPEWAGEWELIVKYLFFDTSALIVEGASDKETASIRDSLELSLKDQQFFVSFLSGSVDSSLNGKSRKGLDTSEDSPVNMVPKLACHLADLEDLLSKVTSMYPVFLRIWNDLLGFKSESIQAVYEHSNSIDTYNLLHGRVLQYFLECQEMSYDLVELYKEYFSLLLTSSDERGQNSSNGDTNQLINPNVYLKIEDTILALLTEIMEDLSSKGSSHDVFEATLEQDDPFVCDQKDLCNTLIEISNPVKKLNIIGDIISIIRSVGEPLLDYPGSLLELLSVKLLSKFSFQTLVKLWPRNLSKVIKDVSEAWSSILDFGLICLCWKLEDLMYSLNDGTAETINVDIFMDDMCGIFVNVVDCFSSLNEVVFDPEELPGLSEDTKSLKIELAEFLHMFGTKIADFATSLKAFYDRTKPIHRFRDFDAMFCTSEKLGPFVNGELPKNLEDALMNVFLIREAKLGYLLGEDLERLDNENVNLEEFSEEHDEVQEDTSPQEVVTRFDTSDEEDNEEDEVRVARETAEREARLNARSSMLKFKLDRKIWTQEKLLSVYSMKLLGLIKANSLSSHSTERFKLNGQKLGQTFGTIVSMMSSPDQVNRESGSFEATEEQSAVVS